MRPKDTKQAIDQLIGDIQKNEWYCLKGDIENELEYWEKNLIVTGLKNMLFGTDSDAHSDIEILICGAKLCPFCAGKPTIQPEGDYWEITCDDCGVFKVGSTYDEALDAWNLRKL